MGKCTHRERSIVLVRYRGRPRTQELLIPVYPQRLIKSKVRKRFFLNNKIKLTKMLKNKIKIKIKIDRQDESLGSDSCISITFDYFRTFALV